MRDEEGETEEGRAVDKNQTKGSVGLWKDSGSYPRWAGKSPIEVKMLFKARGWRNSARK